MAADCCCATAAGVTADCCYVSAVGVAAISCAYLWKELSMGKCTSDKRLVGKASFCEESKSLK
jgi:hypothetical protein